MKKIAIPITEKNEVETHFGHCTFYEIYTFSDANEILDIQLIKSEKGCGCKSNIASVLSKKGVTAILSGYIGRGAINRLKKTDIKVIRGCSGNSADVILKYVNGEILDTPMSCFHYN